MNTTFDSLRYARRMYGFILLAAIFAGMMILAAQPAKAESYDDIPDIVNSNFLDEDIIISPDGEYLYFASTRYAPGCAHERFYDVFAKQYRWDYNMFYCRKVDGKWTEPRYLENEINSKYDGGIISISRDGRRVYFVSLSYDYEKDGGPFYQADLDGDQISNIRGLGGGLAKFFGQVEWNFYETPDGYKEGFYLLGSCISPNEERFYFGTDMGADSGSGCLWVSEKTEGKWSAPRNLGPNINKRGIYNIVPYVSFNENVLYFMSDRNNDSKNFNLFYSVCKDGAWSEPVEITTVLDKSLDFISLKIPDSYREMFITVNRNKERWDNDVAVLDLNREHALPTMAFIDGYVMDTLQKQPQSATITFSNAKYGLEYKTSSDPKTGYYSIIVPSGLEFDVTVDKDGKTENACTMDLTEATDYCEYHRNIYTAPEAVCGLRAASMAEAPALKVYPNPADDFVQVELSLSGESKQEATVTITDIGGRVVASRSISEFRHEELIFDLGGVAGGAYLVHVRCGNSYQTLKFIKAN